MEIRTTDIYLNNIDKFVNKFNQHIKHIYKLNKYKYDIIIVINQFDKYKYDTLLK